MLNSRNIAQVLASLAASRAAKPVILVGYNRHIPMQHGGGIRKHHKKSRSKARWKGARERRVA
mgnify:CR=1 FL=1